MCVHVYVSVYVSHMVFGIIATSNALRKRMKQH